MGLSCLFGHKWNGCKCSKCGKLREEGHNFNGCKCTICGKRRNEGHDFNGCTCEICGGVRNSHHSWKNGKCSICGTERPGAESLFLAIEKMQGVGIIVDNDISAGKQFLMSPENWSEWWGGAVAELKLEEGGFVGWKLGSASKVIAVEDVEGELFCFVTKSNAGETAFLLKAETGDTQQGSNKRFTIRINDRLMGGYSYSDGGAAARKTTQAALNKFKAAVESLK